MEENIPDILTLANKEKFRRRLLISSRILGVLLIVAIFWIGFVQVQYMKDVNQIKAEYGSLGYCYLCGLEAGRSCSCNYISDIDMRNPNFDVRDYFKNIASSNVIQCEDRNNRYINLSDIVLRG